MTIYDRIKMLREDREMTQSDLAKKVGYTSRQMICRIEQGIVDLPLSKVEAIADALNVSAVYLAGYSEEQELIDAFYELNAEGKEKIREYAHDLVLSGAYKKHDSDELVDKA